MNWRNETVSEKLSRLRHGLTDAQEDLIEAEAMRADRMAEIHAFEMEFEAKVGHLIDNLAAIEEELNDYLLQIQNLRNERIFGTGYRSVDEIPELIRFTRIFEPDESNRETYDRMYTQYRELFKKNKKIFKELNKQN